jgi:hypothetical protein
MQSTFLLTSSVYTFAISQPYNGGTYGTETYSCLPSQNDCNQSTGTASNTNTGTLANTGYSIIIPAAIAGALIIASIILLVTRTIRRRRQQA